MKHCTRVFRIVRDKDFIVNYAAVDIIIFNNSQHLGGMVLLDQDMENFENCEYTYRENKQFVGTNCEMTDNFHLRILKYHNYLGEDDALSEKCYQNSGKGWI